MNIGFIGLGVMGRPMARHLAAAGHTLILYDRDLQAAHAAEAAARGARIAADLATLARDSEIIITMLPNGRVVQEVVFGKGGLAAHLRPGQLLLDTSSAEPDLTRATAARLALDGIALVDAPVSGAQEGAESASLVFMVGGAAADVARVTPLLQSMGHHIHHVGGVGAGHVMKCVNNLITAVTWLATAEGMLIGKAHGLDSAAMVDVLNVSTGRSFVSERKMASECVSRRFADPFKLAFMVKDIGIATTLADAAQVPIPLSALCEQLWRAADRAQGQGASITEIVKWCETLAGREL